MIKEYDEFERAGFTETECVQLREMSEKYNIEPQRLISLVNDLYDMPCTSFGMAADELQDLKEKERLVKSDEDCADCLCRVCARNSCNDSYNIKLEGGYANCSCNCNIGDKLIETEDDCPNFLPDED